MTVEQLISDIEAEIHQAAPSDDSELSWDLIKFWASYFLNALVAAECNDKIKKSEALSQIYTKYIELPMEEDIYGNLFVRLTEKVLILENDMGIVLCTSEAAQPIKKTFLEDHLRIEKLRFAKPTQFNPLFYRRQDNLYILGFKDVDIPFETIGIWYIPQQDLMTKALTDEVLISDTTLPMLIDSVVQKCKSVMYGTVPDRDNDGVDTKEVQYHNAIRNQAAQQQPEQPA